MISTSRTTCRVCPHDVRLEEVFSLGDICSSNFLDPAALDPPAAPLTLAVCPSCSLVQLTDTVPFDDLFRHYWYQSGINEAMVAELRDVVLSATSRVSVGPSDHVVDLGANDGTLLDAYKFFLVSRHPIRMAYEPARNLFKDLQEYCETAYNDPFPPSDHHTSWRYLAGGAKIITAIAMAYDLEDPNAFVAGIKRALSPEGVCIIQFQDLAGMLAANAFDNICHEHLEYYTLHSLQRLLAHNDLVVYDVDRRAINGGSLRCYIGHKHPVPDWAINQVAGVQAVLTQLDVEESAGLIDPLDVIHAFRKFDRRVEEIKRQTRAIVRAARAHDGRCDAYGASTKGNTLLQYFGLDHTLIDRLVERSPAKVGKVTAGTRIPIISEEEWRQDPAAVTLVPIWQFREGIIEREASYIKAGGTLVFPLPYVVGHVDPKIVKDLAR